MPTGKPAIAIEIVNVKQIQAAYAKAPAQMVKSLSVAIKTAVFLIQRFSMQNTPVLTGRLRASHYSRFEPLKGEVGTRVNYDRFVHDGTKFIPARPYLATAVADSQGPIGDLFTSAVDSVLDRIGKDSG